MIDIHNHLIYNVDDGSTSLKKSIEILKQAEKNGYTDIIITPHYYEGKNYCSTVEDNLKKLHEIKEKLKLENININIYLGNEVFIDNNILENLENKKITTLNNSRYILIELPLYSEVNYVHDMIFKLISNGITPIIAHPERYRYYHDKPEEYEKMIEEGALLQGNIGTIYNHYGKQCKNVLKRLLKNNMITFMSTDTHNDSKYYKLSGKTYKKLLKITKDKEIVNNLLNLNMLKIINNENI